MVVWLVRLHQIHTKVFKKIKTILTKSFIQSPEFSLKLLKDGHTVEEINRIQGTLDYFKKQAEMAMDVSLDNF